jgi:exodeoxyribonuclease VII large subunit
MEVIAEKLKVLNPLNVLQRGFSIVKQDDKYIKNIKDIDMNKSLNIELSDGTVETKIVQRKMRFFSWLEKN